MQRKHPKSIIPFEVPTTVAGQGDEILICLNCPLPKCTGECGRFREEKLSLKRRIKDERRKCKEG